MPEKTCMILFAMAKFCNDMVVWKRKISVWQSNALFLFCVGLIFEYGVEVWNFQPIKNATSYRSWRPEKVFPD